MRLNTIVMQYVTPFGYMAFFANYNILTEEFVPCSKDEKICDCENQIIIYSHDYMWICGTKKIHIGMKKGLQRNLIVKIEKKKPLCNYYSFAFMYHTCEIIILGSV